MSELPWFRFFPSDWLGGTRGMSAAETGIYITLIATMYERGEPVPEDHKRLARTCGATKAAFSAALENLIDEGKIVRLDEGLWNERVSKESGIRAEKSEAAKKSAEARWNKKPNKNNTGEDANAMRKASERNANQKPEPEKREPNGSPKKGTRLPDDWEPDLEFALSAGLTLSQAEREADKFRDWWPAQPGQKGVKADWARTWKNWCRTAVERQQTRGSPPRQSASDAGYELLRDLENARNRTEDQNHLRLVGPVRQSG